MIYFQEKDKSGIKNVSHARLKNHLTHYFKKENKNPDTMTGLAFVAISLLWVTILIFAVKSI